jgi:hypothetical protein
LIQAHFSVLFGAHSTLLDFLAMRREEPIFFILAVAAAEIAYSLLGEMVL